MTAPPTPDPRVIRHQDLLPLNTLALPGRAAGYRKIADARQLEALPPSGMPRFILGGGSNLVLTGDFDGEVLHMAIPGKKRVAEDDRNWFVEAGAGECWHDFVQWTLAEAMPGLENLSLIPGTVGASPIQNIGAYGADIANFFHSARAWDFATRTWRLFVREECRFAYRDSLFKQEGWHRNGRIAITHVTFRLPKQWQPNTAYADLARELELRNTPHPDPRQLAAAIMAVRQRKLPDPARVPNAGSFFQNPVISVEQAARLRQHYPAMPQYPQPDGRIKVAAGWLIEQAGWKGRNLGPVGMYEQQALVLVNRGGATGHDVVRTMQAIQADVQARFAIPLQPEPVFIGAGYPAGIDAPQ